MAKWLRLRTPQVSNNHRQAESTLAGEVSEHTDSVVVPYDENLLERSRTQWQFGDWQALILLKREILQHHPDRAKLALLAAAAHQQLGNIPAARQFTRLAQDWGCSKRLISQILIAGTHNTLGRAAAIAGREEQALHHFEHSLKIGTPGADLRLLVESRVRGELAHLGLSSSKIEQSVSSEAGTLSRDGNMSAVQDVAEQLQKQNRAFDEHVKKQNAELTSVRKALESTIKKEMLNTAQQLEAFLGIQNFLNHGERLPGMHGWPISPDFALYLIELIDGHQYDLILEFGSGTSTVLMAKTLARIDRQRSRKVATVQVAFEHLEQYHVQTLGNLTQAGLANAVQLTLAPLVPFLAPNGNTYAYYDCNVKLAELAGQMSAAGLKILMIVDGPPGSTGKHARYPAVPAVLKHFKGAALDIVLDDYIRDDEKEVARMWVDEIESIYPSVTLSARKLEKDACLISAVP
ncbi:methyltransferase FkbM [Pseudomonas capeferrum]|nr:methyltransferase FkbM [Pseudomonas capeferrum]